MTSKEYEEMILQRKYNESFVIENKNNIHTIYRDHLNNGINKVDCDINKIITIDSFEIKYDKDNLMDCNIITVLETPAHGWLEIRYPSKTGWIVLYENEILNNPAFSTLFNTIKECAKDYKDEDSYLIVTIE